MPRNGFIATDMANAPLKLLVLGDSPTGETGFARVLKNLLKRWHKAQNPKGVFEFVDWWAIGYQGDPCMAQRLYNLYPAGGYEWMQEKNLSRFITRVKNGGYSHVFLVQDHFNLSSEFAQALMDVADNARTHVTYYVPIDAPLESAWMGLPKLADVCVAYTEYGRNEMMKVGVKGNIPVIPHGVDFDVYKPLPAELHDKNRQQIFGDWVTPDDTVMLNVSTNQRRKGLYSTFQVQRQMLDDGFPTKLLMHMPMEAPHEMTHLDLVAKQFGLRRGVHYKDTGDHFTGVKKRLTEAELNCIYNAADILISTSLGEGWGLPLLESYAAGTPLVAMPDNTACAEIYHKIGLLSNAGATGGKMVLLPQSKTGVVSMMDNSRVRFPTDVPSAAKTIMSCLPLSRKREAPNAAVKEWLNWDRIADQFLSLMLDPSASKNNR